MSQVAVIGGGFGGIASALRLRAKGNNVILFERLNALGGRAQVFKKNNYIHDAGPTVITAPYLFSITSLYLLARMQPILKYCKLFTTHLS